MESRKYFHIFVILLLPALTSCTNPTYEETQQPQEPDPVSNPNPFLNIQEIVDQSTEPFRLPTDVYPVQQLVEIYTRLEPNNYAFWGFTTIKVPTTIYFNIFF